MSFNSLLNKTCTIQLPTVTDSASGTGIKTYSNRATSVKCAIQPKRGDFESEEYSQDSRSTHTGYFLIGQTIEKDDKVIESSIEYIVIFPGDGAGRGHHKEVMLEQLT